MLRFIGKIGHNDVLMCTGWDEVQGIIGREDMLQQTIFCFRNCPLVHSCFVRAPFWVTFLYNQKVVAQYLMQPWRTSGFYQLGAICLESSSKLTTEECVQILDLL